MGRGKTEFELKFTGAPAIIAALPRSLFVRSLTQGKGVWERLETTYYDTFDGDLEAAGISLRLRKKAGRRIQTVKRGANPIARKEFEQVLREGAAFPAKTGKKKIDAAVADIRKKLHPVARTIVDRWTSAAQIGASQVEFAVDLGQATSWDAAGHEFDAPIAEIELELKDGERGDVFDLARLVAANAPVRLTLRSKLEMALALAKGGPYGSLEKPSFFLPPEETAAAALGSALSGVAARMALLHPYIAEIRKAEGVHQMRVALRRLRALERAYRPFLRTDALAGLVRRARGFASALGPARDWDVFLAETAPAALDNAYAPDNGENGAELLKARAETLRAAAWQGAVDAINHPDFTRFLIDLLEFAQSPGLKAEEDLQMPVAKLAPKALTRAWKRAKKTASRIDLVNPAGTHDLRLAGKNLRYQAQMFRAIYPKSKRKEFMAALSSLQEDLGRINDAAAAQRLADEAAGGQGAAAMRAAGFVSGYKAAEARAGAARIAESWKEMRKMTRFWRE